ncbi:DNA replication/repair protein RecF [Mariniplasma anaerobium]|uniref:DNA replication and repair protein RecF n=1 Tax=Mariniplasma anaerobium TaxID=2735436 RepID=A0A7U9TJ20_9MOLU|nr:DNA replication and repair protein RecF [Mariniplasma anaerobium]BCR35111.1 DNA replication and repair protein RecF [Mariniplasma anaerobium]
MIQSILLKNFRNHETFKLEINKPFVYIYGENGSGKTSILEGIYFCSTTKSHRTSDEKELIKTNEMFAQVVIKNDDQTYEIVVSKFGKRTKVNHVEKRKLSEFLGHLNVVMFAPNDLELIQGSPLVRRQFMDFELLQVDKSYLNHLNTYKKVLKQRNSLLKKVDIKDDYTFLNILGDQLYEQGIILINQRKQFLDELNILFKANYQKFSQNVVDIIYKPDQDEASFKKHLQKQQRQDILYQTTLTGPHRDDFFIRFNAFDSKTYTSQGETRLIVIALKLALLEWIESKTNHKVVLLLDDVLSELDQQKQDIFLKTLPKQHQIIMNSVMPIDMDHIQMIELTKERTHVKL